MFLRSIRSILLLAIAVPALYAAPQSNQTDNKNAPGAAKLLSATEAAKLLPDAVFFRGQSASIQGRNSGGVQFKDGGLVLVSLVDTAGYSTSVQERYQAYLITEASISIGSHRLAPGAYGCGFLASDTFVVMDIGGHDLFSVHSSKDPALRRPTPLQVLSSSDRGAYRLYVGRSYIDFTQAK